MMVARCAGVNLPRSLCMVVAANHHNGTQITYADDAAAKRTKWSLVRGAGGCETAKQLLTEKCHPPLGGARARSRIFAVHYLRQHPRKRGRSRGLRLAHLAILERLLIYQDDLSCENIARRADVCTQVVYEAVDQLRRASVFAWWRTMATSDNPARDAATKGIPRLRRRRAAFVERRPWARSGRRPVWSTRAHPILETCPTHIGMARFDNGH